MSFEIEDVHAGQPEAKKTWNLLYERKKTGNLLPDRKKTGHLSVFLLVYLSTDLLLYNFLLLFLLISYLLVYFQLKYFPIYTFLLISFFLHLLSADYTFLLFYLSPFFLNNTFFIPVHSNYVLSTELNCNGFDFNKNSTQLASC